MYIDEELNDKYGSDQLWDVQLHQDPIPQTPDLGNYSTYPASIATKPKKREKRKSGFLIAALGFSLLGSILGAGTALAIGHFAARALPEEDETQQLTVMIEGIRKKAEIEIVQLDTNKEMTAHQIGSWNTVILTGINKGFPAVP